MILNQLQKYQMSCHSHFFLGYYCQKYAQKYISNFDELNDFNYHKNVNKEDKNILKLLKKDVLIFYYYTKLIKVDAVVSGNFVYTSNSRVINFIKGFKNSINYYI